jgi:Methyltransferase domain
MNLRTSMTAGVARQLAQPQGVRGRLVGAMLNRANLADVTAAVKALPLTAGDTVADLGFGGGVGLDLLLRQVGTIGHVDGVDLSATMLGHAARRFRRDIASGRLRLHAASMTGLPLATDSLDGAITLNTPGMRLLGDFVESYTAQTAAKSSRIAMVGVPGDRRDSDIREMGSIAADHFDVLVVREDYPLRGRQPGIAAKLVMEGAHARMAEGTARCRQVEIVCDELAAVRDCMARAKTGDLVVLCVQRHQSVMDALEKIANQAQVGVQGENGSPTTSSTLVMSETPAQLLRSILP